MGRPSSRHDQSRLACEEALSIVALSADRRIDGPLSVVRGLVLDSDALTGRLPHLRGESQLRRVRSVQLKALAHQSELELVTTLDHARDFVVSDVWIRLAWVEGDLQVEIGVRIDVTTLWADGEVFAVLLRLPLVVGLHITKV